MAAFKDKHNGTWYVQFRYTDWRGERKQKLKRGFSKIGRASCRERVYLGTRIFDAETGRREYDLCQLCTAL